MSFSEDDRSADSEQTTPEDSSADSTPPTEAEPGAAGEPASSEDSAAEPLEEPQAEAQEPDAPEPPQEAPAPQAAEDAPDSGETDPSEPEPSEPGPEPASAEVGDVAGGDEKAKAKDVAPGADLDPIAIAPERELTAEERARAEAEAEEAARREAAATADSDADEPEPARREMASIPDEALVQATGKRKRSVARVILRSGDGSVRINDRPLEDYFPRDHHRTHARQPLLTSGYDGSVNVWVRVHGGGISGQAGAVRHGIARALCEVDPELRGELKRRGMLTRDARQKERRKAGLKKARKRPQFSKR